MRKKAILVLEDGSVFTGHSFGSERRSYGEVVFTTSMTGYQEVLTDPSFAGQIVIPTYPLIGNYGINREDIESKKVQVSGFVVREYSETPSNWRCDGNLSDFLASHDIPGIAGVDTRALTRRLRWHGVMMGAISSNESPAEVLTRIKESPSYDNIDFVRQISTEINYVWDKEQEEKAGLRKIVVVDYGVKYNILRILQEKGCAVTVVPCTASAEEILALNPDGVLLSPGPGDPALLDYTLDAVRKLVESKPVMGICLGHQLIAWAMGGFTYKLKFGHRGANHPVKDLETGRIHITSQNHGYAVDADSLKGGLRVSHVNLNDGTVEGLAHDNLPMLTIQYHSEGSPGPQDNVYLFDRFLAMVDSNVARR